MRMLISLFIVLILFNRCKKDGTSLSTSQLLISHTWCPYQTRIVTFDTNRVSTMDTNGIWQIKTSAVKMDTTYTFNSCFLHSTYTFLPDGRLTIQNMCSTSQNSTDTSWSLYQGNLLVMITMRDTIADAYDTRLYRYSYGGQPPFPDFDGGNGFVTSINSSKFTIEQLSSMDLHNGTYNGRIPIDSEIKIVSSRFVTFKSQ